MEDLVVLSFQDPLKIVLLVDCKLDGKLVIVKNKKNYIYINLNTDLVYINCKHTHTHI